MSKLDELREISRLVQSVDEKMKRARLSCASGTDWRRVKNSVEKALKEEVFKDFKTHNELP